MNLAEELIASLQDAIQIEQHKPAEIIVMRFDLEKLDLDEAYNIFLNLQKKFPEHKVLAVPNEISLQFLDKKELQNIVDHIVNFMEEL